MEHGRYRQGYLVNERRKEMSRSREKVYVGQNKNWHKAACSQRALQDSQEELILVAQDLLGYWSTHNIYRCPECKAEVAVDN